VFVGISDEASLGTPLGLSDGNRVGQELTVFVGFADEASLGTPLGLSDGEKLSGEDGNDEGDRGMFMVGDTDGESLILKSLGKTISGALSV